MSDAEKQSHKQAMFRDSQRCRNCDIPQGNLVAASVGGSSEIIGVCKIHTGIGGAFPAFHVSIDQRIMPVILMTEDSPNYHFRSLGCDVDTYFLEKKRRVLASVYRAICKQQGWKLDDFCTYNVVFWLEHYGFDDISGTNLQEAYSLIEKIRKHFYTYIDQIELTPKELAHRPILN